MKSILVISQGVIQILVGVGAVICGAILIVNPAGTLMQMSPDLLKGTPLRDFLIPGVILFLVNGIGQLVGGILTLRKHRFSGYVGAALGMGLMIWIFVQVNMIGGRNFLQYSYFMVGIIETSLAFLIQDHLSSTGLQDTSPR